MVKINIFRSSSIKDLKMSEILNFLQEKNVNQQDVLKLVTQIQENPMAAMQVIQDLGLTSEDIQKMVSMVMLNPTAIKEATEELGLNPEEVERLKKEAGL
jgi:hypothetical protein